MEFEFWVVLDEGPCDELADRVYAAGFDDAIVTTAAGGAATIEIRHRTGELRELIRQAIREAESASLSVRHVLMPREAFPVA